MLTIEQTPNEKGTMAVTVVFTDMDDIEYPVSALTTAQWQLSKTDGTIINDRTFATSVIPDNGIIVLSGDDLQIFEGDTCHERKLAVNIVYNSTYGDNLTATEEISFFINNLVNIT